MKIQLLTKNSLYRKTSLLMKFQVSLQRFPDFSRCLKKFPDYSKFSRLVDTMRYISVHDNQCKWQHSRQHLLGNCKTRNQSNYTESCRPEAITSANDNIRENKSSRATATPLHHSNAHSRIYSSIKTINWKYIRFFRRFILRPMERRGGHGQSAPPYSYI